MTTAHAAPHDSRRRQILALVLLGLALACLAAAGVVAARQRYLSRGMPAGLLEPIEHGRVQPGFNVYLDGYTDEELAETLARIRQTGVTSVKQPFYYSGETFNWAAADRLVAAVISADLTLVPLLDGNPKDSFRPPSPAEFAEWAQAFGERYGDSIDAYIIWDEPNLSSHWGGNPANPAEYAALLSSAAEAIRAVDPQVVIVAGPLAPTGETGPDNLAEPIFLQALYGAGASDSFDVVAAKPYGFDTGPDDRRVDVAVLNFSRPVLLREVMEANGDGHKAIWAGNLGWNSLPDSWTGGPSIWGQTDAAQQAAWTAAALDRAWREWPWMGPMFLENWEPGASGDDPRWGFSAAGRPIEDAIAALVDRAAQLPAGPGYRAVSPVDSNQVYSGGWEFADEFGADISESGDSVRFTFWGTSVGALVRRADYRARLYATVDGAPANALPPDGGSASLVLTAPDPALDYLSLELIADGLEAGPHVLELTASRGWDQWALKGFSVGYDPLSVWQRRLPILLAVAGASLLSASLLLARSLAWGGRYSELKQRYTKLTDRTQLTLAAVAAAIVAGTGWLTWGQESLGIYRRLGDGAQLAATAAAATAFYLAPSVIVYALALLALFVLIILRPAWGLALVALTIPFYVPPLPKLIGGYRFSPVEIFVLTTGAAMAARAVLDLGARRRAGLATTWRVRLIRADYAVLALLVVATVSLLFTDRLDVATNEWRVIVFEPVLFYALFRLAGPTRNEMWVILDAYVLGGVIVALIGLAQVVTGQDLITAEGGLMRLRSIYGSPNNVALYLDRILPLLAAVFLFRRSLASRWRRLAYLAAAVPIAVALLLTFSKGALLLGVPASLAVVFWLWQRHDGRRAWPWIVAGLAASAVLFVIALQVPQLSGRLDLFGETGVFRVNLWRSSLSMLADHPWFGVGLDNFLYAYRGRYILEAAWQEPNLSHPHNVILDFATRLGLFGLLAGLWLFVELVLNLAQAVRSSLGEWLPVAVGFSGSAAAILAHGLVDHSYFLVDLAFSFMLILGVAVWLAGGQAKPVAYDEEHSSTGDSVPGQRD